MEKIWETIKNHPYIFGGIALLVLVLILWPSGASTSSGDDDTLSAEEAAIAAASQANAQLTLAQDQVQVTGMGYAAQEAINAQDDALASHVATLSAGIDTLNINDQLKALTNTNSAQLGAITNTNATQLAALKNTNSATLALGKTQTAATVALGENTNAAQLAAIKNTNAASQTTTLGVAHDQLAGLLNTNSSQLASNENFNATSLASINSTNHTQADLAGDVVRSQTSAQSFIAMLEKMGGVVPTQINVTGGQFTTPAPAPKTAPVKASSPATQKTAASASPTISYSPQPSNVSYGFQPFETAANAENQYSAGTFQFLPKTG